MKVRKIEYMKNKDINIDNVFDISNKAKANIKKYGKDQAMVVRILIDDNNKIHIEYADKINIKNLQEVCKL